jgi:cation transport regulator ChaC
MADRITNYFAYGSNMAEQVITAVAPSAAKIGLARLPDHRLAFTRKSVRWGAGVADVLECRGASVYGVLYAIRTDELDGLDRKEGAPKAYRQANITVMAEGRPVAAMTYVVVQPEPQEVPPRPDYLAQLTQAARDHRLPGSYLDFLGYLEEQFRSGSRDDGLVLTQTADRRFSAGEPLIRLNPADGAHLRQGSFGALVMGDRSALGKVEITDAVPEGTCQADQALRACVGVGGQFCFGNRVGVLPCRGKPPRRSVIMPRALVLPLYAISRNDSEKNYCVVHPDRIKVLGLQEGEFARLFVAATLNQNDSMADIKALSIRVFSGSASEVTRESGNVPYPNRAEFYLDQDGRRQLGLPERGWQGTPILIRPALWQALSSRAIFYGLTALLGIGAFFQLLKAFAPHWNSYIDAAAALAASTALTITVSIIDLRSRFRY